MEGFALRSLVLARGELSVLELTCERCGKAFSSRTKARKYCLACVIGGMDQKVQKCEHCGGSFETTDKRLRLCGECRKKPRLTRDGQKRIARFRYACRMIMAQGYELHDYQAGIKYAVKHLYDVGLWQSALEIAVGLEIIRRRWNAKHQALVMQGQRVDFFFPDVGLVVEVDGHPVHFTPYGRQRDAARDESVRMKGQFAGKDMRTLRLGERIIKQDLRHAGDRIAKALREQERRRRSEGRADKYNWMFGPRKN